MVKKIYKYEALDGASKFEILMPKEAEILTVQIQRGKTYFWALVDPDAQKEARFFERVMTGASIYEGMGVERKYIGTVQLHAGDLVYHLFERI